MRTTEYLSKSHDLPTIVGHCQLLWRVLGIFQRLEGQKGGGLVRGSAFCGEKGLTVRDPPNRGNFGP
jgi:hypothetical protein